jgi:hypothetical protein
MGLLLKTDVMLLDNCCVSRYGSVENQVRAHKQTGENKRARIMILCSRWWQSVCNQWRGDVGNREAAINSVF